MLNSTIGCAVCHRQIYVSDRCHHQRSCHWSSLLKAYTELNTRLFRLYRPFQVESIIIILTMYEAMFLYLPFISCQFLHSTSTYAHLTFVYSLTKHYTALHELVQSSNHRPDAIALTETWITSPTTFGQLCIDL